MVSFLSPLATDGIGFAYGYVFVACNLAGAFLVWFMLYESATLSLENVDQMYGQPNLKPWHSHKWVPEGYTTRKIRDQRDDVTRVGSQDGVKTERSERRFERSEMQA
jgi:SP family sugar:H+ symporter-like MFS transporter